MPNDAVRSTACRLELRTEQLVTGSSPCESGGQLPGSGTQPSWSSGTTGKRCAVQSALACSMYSRSLCTKFHQMNRWPTGSPPSSTTVPVPSSHGVEPAATTERCPTGSGARSRRTSPSSTSRARSSCIVKKKKKKKKTKKKKKKKKKKK